MRLLERLGQAARARRLGGAVRAWRVEEAAALVRPAQALRGAHDERARGSRVPAELVGRLLVVVLGLVRVRVVVCMAVRV